MLNPPEDGSRIQALYDSAPYPDCLEGNRMGQSNVLLTHWINAASGFERPALSNHSRILVAGCGTGAEAFVLHQLYPEAEILGIDFSQRSIALARQSALHYDTDKLRFEVEDLMMPDWCSRHKGFDFVLCYGVADYVLDPALLLLHLSRCMSERGLLYMVCNSPYHPAGRIRQAFAGLGIQPGDFEDDPKQRSLLEIIDTLMGATAQIAGLGKAPKAYLKVDIFPPLAHHLPIDAWLLHAERAGLHFCGSMDAPLGLLKLSDAQLPLLYSLDKAALSLWMIRLCQYPGMQLLFGRNRCEQACFTQPELLGQWKPRLDACLGALPDLEPGTDPNKARNITLRFQGMMDFVLYSTAYDLAVLKRCDGRRSLSEIRAEIPAEGYTDSLLACLFRAYHYGLLA